MISDSAFSLDLVSLVLGLLEAEGSVDRANLVGLASLVHEAARSCNDGVRIRGDISRLPD